MKAFEVMSWVAKLLVMMVLVAAVGADAAGCTLVSGSMDLRRVGACAADGCDHCQLDAVLREG